MFAMKSEAVSFSQMCSFCGRLFNDAKILQQHIAGHENAVDKQDDTSENETNHSEKCISVEYLKDIDAIGKYACELCSNVYEDFGSHLCFSHGMVKCRKDRRCKLYFGSTEAREDHEIFNHDNSRTLWKSSCDKCGNSFSDQYKLSHHKYVQHKIFSCSLCTMGTSAENFFKSHIKSHKFNSNALEKGFLNFLNLQIAGLNQDLSSIECKLCTLENVSFSTKEGGELALQHFQIEHDVAKSSDVLLHSEMKQSLSKTADILLRLFNGRELNYKCIEQISIASPKRKEDSTEASPNKKIKVEPVFQHLQAEDSTEVKVEIDENLIKSEESMDWFAGFITPGDKDDEVDDSFSWDEQIQRPSYSEKPIVKLEDAFKESKALDKPLVKIEDSSKENKPIEKPRPQSILVRPNPQEFTEVTVKAEPTGNLTWATIIPLIGGSAIGCSQSAGNLPAFHLSYTPFSNNEAHLDRYWPEVPKYLLDKDPTVEFQGIDYVNSVCPCAGLSMLNTGRNNEGGVARGSDNESNKWMFDTSNYVLDKIKPKVFWGENAPGLFSDMGKGVVDGLIEVGKKYGYSFSMIRTNSELHGLPQKRIRTFYFFWNTPTVPKLNWKDTPAKDLLDFLNEIPKEATLQDLFMNEGKASERFRPYQFVLEREGLTHKEFFKKQKTGTISRYLERNNLEQECIEWLREKYPNEKFSQINQSGRTHIQYIEHCINKKSKGKGYWDDSPRFYDKTFGTLMSKTMATAVHPTEDRYLNVREMMHLMGLPHDFDIGQSDSLTNRKNKINHIAQNVPVNTAKDWADEVKLFCEGKLPLTDYTFLKQDNIEKSVVCGTRLGDSEARFIRQNPFEDRIKKEIKVETEHDESPSKNNGVQNTGSETFKCDQCNKRFIRETGFKKHQLMHANEMSENSLKNRHVSEINEFNCDQCPNSYKSKNHLTRHQFQHNSGEGNFICDQCSNIYKTQTALSRHQLTHGDKPHMCSYCQKSFHQLSNLKQHERLHSGEKPYICDGCGKGYTQSTNLKLHREKCHPSE